MSTVALIADLHFGRTAPGAPGALLDALRELRPDVVVAAGDFTMAGRRREFEAASAFLGRVAAPIVACPGNHDIPAYNLVDRFFRALARYNGHIGSRTLSRFAVDELALLAVNSARPWDLSFDWSHGRLSTRQIADAEAFFAKHADAAVKMLVTHHPFVLPPSSASFRRIGNADRAVVALSRVGVDAVLTGHLHRHGVSVLAARADDGGHRGLITIQAGTALSDRYRDEANGFAVIRCGNGIEAIEHHVFDGTRFVLDLVHDPSDGV